MYQPTRRYRSFHEVVHGDQKHGHRRSNYPVIETMSKISDRKNINESNKVIYTKSYLLLTWLF